MVWDFTENAGIFEVGGAFSAQLDWVVRCVENLLGVAQGAPKPVVTRQSATSPTGQLYDAIITDPPYYDAIPYSDCADFFYIWLKRLFHGTKIDDGLFNFQLTPKWDAENSDGELIDDASRHGNDKNKSKQAYEDGMAKVFSRCYESLKPEGRLVVVFANKNPDAWETLASAIIRAGFMVTASWPIQTEMPNRIRGLASAALSSSVWLVCQKRPASAPSGWDGLVLKKMEEYITESLRNYWDEGIRGPDFIWAATGPALAAFSAHPIVKKASKAGQVLDIAEFLIHVRRLVIKFVLSRLLPEGATVGDASQQLDSLTAYYLLHRNDFGLEKAQAGAYILYATACNITDRELASTNLLAKKSKKLMRPMMKLKVILSKKESNQWEVERNLD
jgi:adenine-specific DNA methylase